MKKILLQLDTDPRPCVFDRVVAIDAGADEVIDHGGITADDVRGMVYGLIFTRGAGELQNSAVFIGGQDVARGEEVFKAIEKTFLGDLRVSVMLDSSGANTTAAAAVIAASRHVDLTGVEALVLGGTGPVGQRVARLLQRQGAGVRIASRQLARAQAACDRVGGLTGTAPAAFATSDGDGLNRALDGVAIVIAAGGPGVTLLPTSVREAAKSLKVAIDLNAVPPPGIEGIEVHEKAVDRDGVVCYGAVGVGRTKMKIHKRAVASLFESKGRSLDAEEVFDIGLELA